MQYISVGLVVADHETRSLRTYTLEIFQSKMNLLQQKIQHL